MATPNDIIKGLQILSKYSNPDDHTIEAYHDVIFGPNVSPDNIDENDLKELKNHLWRWDKELLCWKRFT